MEQPVADDLAAIAPVSEATIATWQGFDYVVFAIDTFARRIVGWRVLRTARTGFVLDALEQALHDRCLLEPISNIPPAEAKGRTMLKPRMSPVRRG
ncbi:hypothetical protein GCM10022293_18980 [Azospirillum formosense]